MRVSRRGVFAVVGSIMAATALTACGGGGSTAKSNANGVLNIGMPNGPQTDNNNPYLSSSAANSLGYKQVIFEPLAMINRVKPTDPAKPWLATKFDWPNNYQQLTLTIRDNVKWSDGQAFSADDVKFTFDLLKATPGLNHNAVPFGDTTVSGNQVTATFTSPQFVNEYQILTDTPILPKHQWSTFKDPATDPVKDPVGTGPYKLKTFTPQTVTLDVRDDYWQDKPQVKELRYTSYTDNNSQTTALATGACDWAFVFIPNAKAVFISKDPAHNQLFFPPDLALHGLWINTTRKPFDNPALRQAGRTAALYTLQKIFVDQMPMIATSASNLGGEYSTKNWVGWPTNDDPHPTLPTALTVILKLRPAA